MIKRIKSTRIVTELDTLLDGYLYFDTESGLITHVGDGTPAFDSEEDIGELDLAPGLIDIHTHGAAGYDYGEVTSVEQALAALNYQASRGATTVLATLTSASDESLISALEVMQEVYTRSLAGNLGGVHIEGPFFAPEAAGAQNPEYMTAPRPELYEKIVERFGDMILRWDYAPERDKDGTFARYLNSHGIKPSAGHSMASAADIGSAMENGMNLITHLYSCMSTITRRGGFRVLGIIESAYLYDELWAEIICDGCHLPEELLRLIFKTKSHERLVLITDSLKVAGTDAMEGSLSGIDFVIEDGVCKLKDRTAFAGSIATSDTLVRIASTVGGLSVAEAVNLASRNPATLFGMNKGRLKAGYDADLIVFDENINISKVLIRAKQI